MKKLLTILVLVLVLFGLKVGFDSFNAINNDSIVVDFGEEDQEPRINRENRNEFNFDGIVLDFGEEDQEPRINRT